MSIQDDEEKILLTLFESGQIKPSEKAKQEMMEAKKTAAQHLKKDARINIRLSQFDLTHLKRIAAAEGLPYQTLISSVLHKYAHHTLKL